MKGWRGIGRESVKLALIAAGVFLVRTVAFGMYEVPSGSMLPTIRVGDRLVANKLAYGLWLPFQSKQVVSWAIPRRGDIVLFQARDSQITLIKRVVGLPGETLSFRRGRLLVDGVSVGESSGKGEIPDEVRFASERFVETFGEGLSHEILRASSAGFTSSDNRVYKVPSGHVLCMGDNRDDSRDGRFWGSIPIEEIYGRAERVTFSFAGLTHGLRWERTGKSLY